MKQACKTHLASLEWPWPLLVPSCPWWALLGSAMAQQPLPCTAHIDSSGRAHKNTDGLVGRTHDNKSSFPTTFCQAAPLKGHLDALCPISVPHAHHRESGAAAAGTTITVHTTGGHKGWRGPVSDTTARPSPHHLGCCVPWGSSSHCLVPQREPQRLRVSRPRAWPFRPWWAWGWQNPCPPCLPLRRWVLQGTWPCPCLVKTNTA
jgi:hypothetical protein